MVTDRDRAHFAAIAEGERASEDERIARALLQTPSERILEGFALGLELPWTPAILAEMDAVADGQMELARRRVALNLGTKPRRSAAFSPRSRLPEATSTTSR